MPFYLSLAYCLSAKSFNLIHFMCFALIFRGWAWCSLVLAGERQALWMPRLLTVFCGNCFKLSLFLLWCGGNGSTEVMISDKDMLVYIIIRVLYNLIYLRTFFCHFWLVFLGLFGYLAVNWFTEWFWFQKKYKNWLTDWVLLHIRKVLILMNAMPTGWATEPHCPSRL